MSDPVSVRGYRPGRCMPSDEENAERETVRLANLERYVMRARAGLPIFEDAGVEVFGARVAESGNSANVARS